MNALTIRPASGKSARRFCPAQVKDKVNYGLRFQILPGPLAVQKARETADYCAQHHVPAVHLFFNAEEWNRGHAVESEIQQWLDMFQRIIPIFRKAGLGVSLNPWSTTLHCDRGRALRKGQNFGLMISPSGKKAKAVASLACPRWRKYIAELYGHMAELGFDVLWIEDDFRYHNHSPLDWGGDFSPAMLKLFSAKIGRKVGRQEVVNNVLKPGKPHPWRKLWLGLWRECSEETAVAIRAAVAVANPNARLGLMSSHPDTHASEGRDWDGLFKDLAIGGRAWHRPHFAHYGDEVNAGLFYSYSLLDMQKRFRPVWVESHVEIENSTFSRFRKSDTQTFIQMALAKIMGSEGLLLDLHSFAGNVVFEEPEVGELLDKSYSALQWLGSRFPRNLVSQGIGVPFIPSAPLGRRLKPGAEFNDLTEQSEIAGNILGRCGIAWQMDFSPAVNVVWGSNAWGLTDEQIRQCLTRGLWLDAEAAEIFVARGFGRHLGIKIEGWRERQKSLYAVERIALPETGARVGFNLSCNRLSRVLQFQAVKGAKTWTDLVDCLDRRMGAALSLYRNVLGGITAVSAFPLAKEWESWNLNFQRQILTQNLVRTLARGNNPVMVLHAPHFLVIDLVKAGERRVAAINLAFDPAAPEIVIPGAKKMREAKFILPLQKPVAGQVDAQLKDGEFLVRSKIKLPFCGMLVMLMS